MRFAKSPAQSQKGFKKKHLVFALNKNPGDRVDERMVIGTQKRLNYHPGLNVSLARNVCTASNTSHILMLCLRRFIEKVGINPRDKSLYALCAGTVYYSIEKFVPNADNPLVQQYYVNRVNLKADTELTPRYIKYVHVVPDKTTNEFRLVDVV